MEHLVYYLYRVTVWMISILPTSLVAHLGYALGRVLGPLLLPYQRLIRTNLDLALGSTLLTAQKEQIRKKHFALLCSNILAGVNLADRPLDQSLARTQVEGLQNLLDILESGRGVIAMMTHSSNWEIVARLSPFLFKTACAAVYQPLRNRQIDRHIRKQRKREGLQLFDRRRLSGISSILRSRGVVGILSDQNAGHGGVWCPLFGRITSSSPLIPILAKGTKAAVLSISVETVSIGCWKIVISPEIPLVHDDLAASTALLNHAIEQIVHSSPEDWLWSHDRWKVRKRIQLLHSGTKREIVTTGVTHPYRIIFASPENMEDASVCLLAVKSLQAGRPDAELHILSCPTTLSGWEATCIAAHLHPVLHLPLTDIVERIRALKADAAICLHANRIFVNACRSGGVPRIATPLSFPKMLQLQNPLLHGKKGDPKTFEDFSKILMQHIVHLGGPSLDQLDRVSPPVGPNQK